MPNKLLDRDYIFRGVIYEQGVREVPDDFPARTGTFVGAPASGAPLSADAARLLVGLSDADLRAALELKGLSAPAGADRAAMLGMVGLSDTPPADTPPTAPSAEGSQLGAPGTPPPTAAPTPTASPASAPIDYEAAWNKDQLQAEVERRGLTVTGSGSNGNVLKSDLVEALMRDDENAAIAGTPA